jgi:hypothetical protein
MNPDSEEETTKVTKGTKNEQFAGNKPDPNG